MSEAFIEKNFADERLLARHAWLRFSCGSLHGFRTGSIELAGGFLPREASRSRVER
jgi:hypothetical protein